MQSKFVIFLVLARLAQSSYVPTSTAVTWGLSEEQLTVFDQITIEQKTSGSLVFEAVENIFAILQIHQPDADGDDAKAAEALDQLKDAVDSSVNGILTSLEKSCPAVAEATRKASYSYLKDSFPKVIAAFELASSGDYSENRDAIEVYHAGVKEDFTNVIASVYNLIYTCVDTTDADILAVIESGHNGSRLSFVRIANAVFNAIKINAVAGTKGYTSSVTVMSKIEEVRVKATNSIKNDIEHKFGALKAVFLDSHLKKKGIVSALAANQYGLIVSTNAFTEAVKVLFTTVKSYLRDADLGLYDDGENYLSRIDLASNALIAIYRVGHGAMLDAALAAHPESSSTIDAGRDMISTVALQQVEIFSGAIVTAVAPCRNYTETLDKIEAAKTTAVRAAPDYTALLIGYFRNNETFDHKTEAKLASLQQLATYGAVTYATKFFDAVEILAKATHAGEVTDDDFHTVRDYYVTANSVVDDFCQGIYASGVEMLRAHKARC